MLPAPPEKSGYLIWYGEWSPWQLLTIIAPNAAIKLTFLAPLLTAASGAYDVGDWCVYSYSFCLILTKLATHGWSKCQYGKNCRTDYQNFDFKIFGKIFLITNLNIVSTTAAAEALHLVAWHSGRTSVSDRRTFAVLRSTCGWQMTTYVGKPSAVGQPTRPTESFVLSV